jgi:hypothetical protein
MRTASDGKETGPFCGNFHAAASFPKPLRERTVCVHS